MVHIIGAGLTGLSAAFQLSRQGVAVRVLEKTSTVGGLAKSVVRGGYTYDYGPHRFHSKDQTIIDEFKELLGSDVLMPIRKSQIYLGKKRVEYPLKVSAILSLSPLEMVEVFLTYFKEKVVPSYSLQNPQNFEEYMVPRFGKKLYELFFQYYTEKVWGIPCTQLSPQWAIQRIQMTDPVQAFIKMAFRVGKMERTAVPVFYFPKKGIGQLAESYAERVKQQGGTITTDVRIDKIQIEDGRISSIVYEWNGKEKKESCKALISTAPLPTFLSYFSPQPPENVLRASSQLLFRSSLFVFLLLRKPLMSENHWIYFPQKEIAFGRISEMKNFSPSLYPSDKTGVIVEYFCTEGDKVWTLPDKEIIHNCIQDICKTDLVKEEEIGEAYVERVPSSYPVYTVGYEKHLETIQAYLSQYNNCVTAGRNGLHRYNNMDHAIEMGRRAAQTILGKKMEIDVIGKKKEYFETTE